MGLGVANTAERIALIGLLHERNRFLQSGHVAVFLVCERALEACELCILPVPGVVLQEAGAGSFDIGIALNLRS